MLFAVLVLLLVTWLPLGHTAEITALTCGRTDVGNAITAASDGDTVKIPAGTCSWSSLLTVTKQLFIIGAGIDSTIITDASSTGTWSLSGVNLMRLAHMTITGTVGTANLSVTLAGNNKRVDHIKFNFSNDFHAIRVNGNLTNVLIDHCHFTGNTRGVNVFGNASYWTDAAQYAPGTRYGAYIEDSTFDRGGVEVLDIQYGGAYVARYNTLTDGGNFAMHGADSGDRSGGYTEMYNNTFINIGTTVAFAIIFRGGSQYVYNNDFQGLFTNIINLQNKRSCWPNAGPYHTNNANRCEHNSVNALDGDVAPEDNGWPCKDQIGRGPNQSSHPSYQWGNTRDSGAVTFHPQNVGDCSNPSTLDHLQEGRDFFDDTTAPGYTALAYPHPLIAETEGTPPVETLVAYWPLNDGTGSSSAADNTANNNDGTLNGLTTSTAWLPGIIGGALNFDGDGYVEVPDDASLNFGVGEDFTVLVWVRTTTALNTTYPALIQKMNADHTIGWEIIRASSSDGCTPACTWYGTLRVDGTPHAVQASTTIADNRWHLLALQREGETLRTWHNGVLVGELTDAEIDQSVTNTSPLRMGRSNFAALPYYYTGDLDEARIYNYALTGAEILALYQTGAPAAKPGRLRGRGHLLGKASVR